MPACPARPRTVMRGSRLPRQATHTTRPLGSGTIAASAVSVRAANSPPAPVDSSSVTVLTIRSPASGDAQLGERAGRHHHARDAALHVARAAAVEAAVADDRGERVGLRPVARGSASTTSTWPLSSSVRPPPLPRKRATSCGRPSNVSPSGTIGMRPQRAGVGLVELDLGAVGTQQRRQMFLQRALLAPRGAGRVRDRVEADELARERDERVTAGGERIGDAAFLGRELHEAIP